MLSFRKILTPPIVHLGSSFFCLIKKRWYAAPSLRQMKILRRYVIDGLKVNRESVALNFLEELGARNNIILDIGGNIGYSAFFYNLFLEKNGGVCFSFEPLALNRIYMARNLKHSAKVILMPFGLANVNSELYFDIPQYVYASGRDPTNTGFISAKYSSSEPSGYIDVGIVVRLDDLQPWFDAFPKYSVSYMKIDVEGYECQVFQSAVNILTKYKPIIQFEYNTNVSTCNDLLEIIGICEKLGYKFFSQNEDFNCLTDGEVYCVPDSVVDCCHRTIGLLHPVARLTPTSTPI